MGRDHALVVAAGYLDIPGSHKLALIKFCDSANRDTRIGFPGLEALQVWCGASRARVMEIVADLQSWGLLMQVGSGHRGRRAAFKVFPDPGDEGQSVTVRKGEACPGADSFKGVPGIPTPEEVETRVASRPKRQPRGGKSSPSEEAKGPKTRTLSAEGSVRPVGPIEVRKGPTQVDKGSEDLRIGSDGSDPFGTNLRFLTSSTDADASGVAPGDPDALFAVPAPEPRQPNPVQLLVGAYCDVIDAARGFHTTSMRQAIGRHCKRILKEDDIPLPILLVAVQRAAAKRDRQVDKYLGDAQESYGRSDQARRAMFDAWNRVAEQATNRNDRIGA